MITNLSCYANLIKLQTIATMSLPWCWQNQYLLVLKTWRLLYCRKWWCSHQTDSSHGKYEQTRHWAAWWYRHIQFPGGMWRKDRNYNKIIRRGQSCHKIYHKDAKYTSEHISNTQGLLLHPPRPPPPLPPCGLLYSDQDRNLNFARANYFW